MTFHEHPIRNADQFIKLDKKKLKEATAQQEENGKNGGDDNKKRKYNAVNADVDVTDGSLSLKERKI